MMATLEGEDTLVVKRSKVTSSTRLVDVEAQVDPEEDKEAKKWRDMERTLMTRVVQGIALASLILNLLAMIYEWSVAAALAGIVAIPVGCAVIFYQFALQDEDTLRKVQNDLRHKVNDFADLNVALGENNTKLEGELAPLKDTEAKLASIAEKNGASVITLRELVKENQKTLDGMNKNIKDDVLQSMMEAVLNAERDEDGKFSDREIKMLAIRLKGLPAIDVDEEKFAERASLTRSLSSVFDMMRTITDDKIPEDERIFTIVEEPPV